MKRMKRTESGQVLVVFALGLVAFLGIVSLVLDVSRAYAQERYQRTVSDAASLAGAQDLFQPDSRDVPAGGPANARKHAMDLLVRQLGASSTPDAATCNQDCPLPGTPYRVWITTPSPTCVACDPSRSVQVTIRNPSFSVTFARLFGQGQWNISTTSVSGITTSIRYALVTLRPSFLRGGRNNPNDLNVEDIKADGQTTDVNILSGDVGDNTSVAEQVNQSGGCALEVASGFSVYHLSTDLSKFCQAGSPPAPREILLQDRIPDPGHVSDARFADIRNWLRTNRPQTYNTWHTPTSCAGVTSAPSVTGLTTYCYRPGYYPDANPDAFSVGNNELAYLLPGTYFFDGDVTIHGPAGGNTSSGMLVGGNQSPLLGDASSGTGVVLMFPKTATFSTAAGVGEILNMGDATCAQDSCRAKAPNDIGSYGPLVGLANLPLTFIVERNPACFTGLDPTNGDCAESNVINLAGGGKLRIAGIVYAPSDYVQVNSEPGSQTGEMGQIISWHVKYSGNTSLNQSYPGQFEPGVMRIDAACTKGSPVMPCNAP